MKMLSKCSWDSVSDSQDVVEGSFTVITLKLVSQSFGKSARFLQMYEETLCALCCVCLKLVEITVWLGKCTQLHIWVSPQIREVDPTCCNEDLAQRNKLIFLDFLGGSDGKSVCLKCGRPWLDPWVRKIPLEKEMSTHSSTLAWKIPWTDWGAWQAIVHEVAKSRTRTGDFIFAFTNQTGDQFLKVKFSGIFLVVQWLRIHLAMQGDSGSITEWRTKILHFSGANPTFRGAAEDRSSVVRMLPSSPSASWQNLEA